MLLFYRFSILNRFVFKKILYEIRQKFLVQCHGTKFMITIKMDHCILLCCYHKNKTARFDNFEIFSLRFGHLDACILM